MYKIVVGIPNSIAKMSMDKSLLKNGVITDYEVKDDEDIWCDFELAYDPYTNSYTFGFETMLGFEEKDGARNWIVHCLSVLTDYMHEHGYDTSKELDLYQVFTAGVNVDTTFFSIEEAYAWLKLMVFGFHGQGLN